MASSMLIRVAANLDAIRRDMAETRQIVQQAGTSIQTMGRDASVAIGNLNTASANLPRTNQSILQSLAPLASAFGVAFSVGAVINFGRQLLADADALMRLSDKTGIAVEAIQRLKFIAEQTGPTFEQMSTAVGQLQIRLAGGNESALAALQRLGIEFEEFKRLAPDQQFIAIAIEVAKIEDPMLRAQVATDLFGKTGMQVMPALRAEVEKIAAAAPIMSKAAVESLDMLGDTMSSVWSTIKAVAGETVALLVDGFVVLKDAVVGSLTFVGDALLRLGQTAGALARGDLKDATTAFFNLKSELPELPPALNLVKDATGLAGLSMKDMDAISKDLTKSVEAQWKETEKSTKKHEEQAKALDPLVVLWGKYKTTIGEYVTLNPDYTEVIREQTSLLEDQVDAFNVRVIPSIATARGQFVELKAAVEENRPALEDWNDELAEVKPNSDAAVAGMVNMAQGAISLVQSLQSAARSTDNLGAAQQTFSATAGFASAAGLGAMSSTGVGAIAAGAMLIYQMKKDGDAAREMLRAMRDTFGEIQEEMQEMVGTGTDLVGFMEAFGLDYNTAFGPDAQQNLQTIIDLQHELGEALFELNSDLGELMQSADALGQRLPDAILASIARLQEMGILTEENSDLFDHLAGEAEVDFHAMEEAAERYGLDLRSLGPQFHAGRLHEAAQQIWEDFVLLRRGGTDVGTILVGMQEEISALVNDSIEFGTTIPEQFRPLIANLIESGRLIDANGVAITDMSQIEFGDPIVTKFEEVIAKLQELIDKLAGPLTTEVNNTVGNITRVGTATEAAAATATTAFQNAGSAVRTFGADAVDAINRIPRHVQVDVETRYTEVEIPMSSSRSIGEGFAGGTFGAFGEFFHDFGARTRTNLHGREAVVTEGQAVPFAQAVLGGGSDELAGEMRAIRSLLADQPRAIAVAVMGRSAKARL